MQINHNALVKKVAVSESNPGYAAPNDGLDMNFEQKRRLSIAIGQLPGDKISEVLRIIAEDDSMRMRVSFPPSPRIQIINDQELPIPSPQYSGCSFRVKIDFG